MSTVGKSWEVAETKLLINLRQSMDREFTSKKRNAPLWKKISECVNNAGYRRTDKQCKEKWKNLLSEFKRVEVQKETEQQAFPYYTALKDFLSKHSSLQEQPGTVPSLTMPTLIDSVTKEHSTIANSYLPSARMPSLVNYSSTYNCSHPFSTFSYHMIRPPIDQIPTASSDRPLIKKSSDYNDSSSPDLQHRSRIMNNKAYTTLLTDVVELLHREIGERRMWEERLERSRKENERRRERQERRRKRREKARLERQKAQTLLLVAIASKILPNISDLIRSANFHDITSSESDKSG